MAPKVYVDRAPKGAMSTTANFDGSICGLCNEKIAKGSPIVNHENKWCHEKCVDAKGSTPKPAAKPEPEKQKPTDWEPPEHTAIPKPSEALIDFILQENMLLLQIEAVITKQNKDVGLPINGQQIGMHTREIYLQAKKTNLIKASEIK